jgi:hypothetical protein
VAAALLNALASMNRPEIAPAARRQQYVSLDPAEDAVITSNWHTTTIAALVVTGVVFAAVLED